jgi:uncharacterized membrane protein YkgB
VCEWTFGALLFAGFWDKRLGLLGAVGSTATFISTVTIIPFMPDGWDASAGGFPTMTGNIPFLMKDVVLLAVSLYLLKQDAAHVVKVNSRSGKNSWLYRWRPQERRGESTGSDGTGAAVAAGAPL